MRLQLTDDEDGTCIWPGETKIHRVPDRGVPGKFIFAPVDNKTWPAESLSELAGFLVKGGELEKELSPDSIAIINITVEGINDSVQTTQTT